jgi:hypothetical protein
MSTHRKYLDYIRRNAGAHTDGAEEYDETFDQRVDFHERMKVL